MFKIFLFLFIFLNSLPSFSSWNFCQDVSVDRADIEDIRFQKSYKKGISLVSKDIARFARESIPLGDLRDEEKGCGVFCCSFSCYCYDPQDTIDEAAFTRIFPINRPVLGGVDQGADGGVGQMRMQDHSGKNFSGTGTLIRHLGGSQFEGITCQHNLRYQEPTGTLRLMQQASLYLGQSQNIGGYNELKGTVDITACNIDPHRDIALFRGRLQTPPNPAQRQNLINQAAARIHPVSLARPLINANFGIVHHPDGDNIQRINQGNIVGVMASNPDKALHNTATLPGSSGSAGILADRSIGFIHTEGDRSKRVYFVRDYGVNRVNNNKVLSCQYRNWNVNGAELIDLAYVATLRATGIWNKL